MEVFSENARTGGFLNLLIFEGFCPSTLRLIKIQIATSIFFIEMDRVHFCEYGHIKIIIAQVLNFYDDLTNLSLQHLMIIQLSISCILP